MVVRFWRPGPIYSHIAGNSIIWNKPHEKQVSDVSKTMLHSHQRPEHPAEQGCLIKSAHNNWSKHCAATRSDHHEDAWGGTCGPCQTGHLRRCAMQCLWLCLLLLDKLGQAGSRRFQAGTCLEHMLFMSEFLGLGIRWCKTGLSWWMFPEGVNVWNVTEQWKWLIY